MTYSEAQLLIKSPQLKDDDQIEADVRILYQLSQFLKINRLGKTKK